MKYHKFEIIDEIETGRDVLGNPITEEKTIGTFMGRIVQWTAEDVSLIGREVTSSSSKLLTMAPASTIQSAKRVKVGDKMYDIGKIPDLGRWRALYLKGWKN